MINYFLSRLNPTPTELEYLNQVITYLEIPAKTLLIKPGKVERTIYFVEVGIVRGYQYQEDKLVVEHIVEAGNFFTALESFMYNQVSSEYFESVGSCKICKISRTDFDQLKKSGKKWQELFDQVQSENIRCKMERIKDFQTLSAKDRYLKLLNQSPHLIAQVSVETLASFLGIEPQSLSRIRKQITI